MEYLDDAADPDVAQVALNACRAQVAAATEQLQRLIGNKPLGIL